MERLDVINQTSDNIPQAPFQWPFLRGLRSCTRLECPRP